MGAFSTNDHQGSSQRPGSTPDLRNLTLHTSAKGADVFWICCVFSWNLLRVFKDVVSLWKIETSVSVLSMWPKWPKGLKIRSLQRTQLGHWVLGIYPLMVWCVLTLVKVWRPRPYQPSAHPAVLCLATGRLQRAGEWRSHDFLWQFWSNFFMFIVFADSRIRTGIVDWYRCRDSWSQGMDGLQHLASDNFAMLSMTKPWPPPKKQFFPQNRLIFFFPNSGFRILDSENTNTLDLAQKKGSLKKTLS